MYWNIGRVILDAQEKEGWGAKIIDNIAKEIKSEFPELKGFSLRNLKYMKKFAEEYKDVEFVQQVVAQIPWSHNVILMDKIKDGNIRKWYLDKVLENGWSRNVLIHYSLELFWIDDKNSVMIANYI